MTTYTTSAPERTPKISVSEVERIGLELARDTLILDPRIPTAELDARKAGRL